MREAFERLVKNFRHFNSGEAKHPVMEHMNNSGSGHELYRRFYGKRGD